MTKTLINYNVDVTIKLIKTLPFFSLVAVHTLFSAISFYLSCSSGRDINKKKIPNTCCFYNAFKINFHLPCEKHPGNM